MDDVKGLFASKTFWGALVAGLASILGIWGKELSPEDQTRLVELGAALVGALGALLAIVGRVTATKTIRGALNAAQIPPVGKEQDR
jgi:hypothetical protein